MVPEVQKTLTNRIRINEPFLMLIIPFVWLYVKKLENPLLKFKPRFVLHFLPFVVFMSVNGPAFVHGSSSMAAQFLSRYAVLFYGAIWCVLLVQYSAYLVQIVRISRQLKNKAQQELSNIEHVDISWIKTFLYVFIVSFVIIALMFTGALHNFGGSWLNQLVPLVFSIAVFILGHKGLFQQAISTATDEVELPKPEVLETVKPKAVRDELSQNLVDYSVKPKAVDDELSKKLLDYMESCAPHRNSELSLSLLASQIQMSRNQLSEVINSNMGCNFYDFVNKYRVEDVKQLMVDPKYKDFTILAIAFEAGFPSKSTFNSIFKKITGLTPSEYKSGLK
jgi:AraC-like DNA-binding protein